MSLWPFVVLLIAAGAFVLGWRWLTQREEEREQWTEAIAELDKKGQTLAAKTIELHDELDARVKHLEALTPETEGLRRSRRIG